MILLTIWATSDPETGREEGQVSLWWDEHGTTGDAASEGKEEGQQVIYESQRHYAGSGGLDVTLNA